MPVRVLFGADAGGGSTPAGGDTERTDAQIEELARDAVGKALADGGAESASDLTFAPNDATDKIVGALKPGVVDAANLDADDADKQRKLRDAINAEAKLRAGTAVSIGAPDADGVRTIGVHPRPADGPLGAKDAYDQQALDRSHKWRMGAIQYREPHVIRLKWFPNPPNTPATYEGSVEIAPGVSALLGYVPLSQSASNRGLFTLATEPVCTERTMSTLFPGKTVQSLQLQLGVDEAAARAAQPFPVPVQIDPGIGNTLGMIAKERRLDDPSALTGASKNAVAIINFLFESTVPGTGTVKDWKPKGSTPQIPTELLPTNAEISGVTWDGTSLWVLLGWAGRTVTERQAEAIVFTNRVRDRTKGISQAALDAAFPRKGTLPGIVWNGRSIVIRGEDGGAKAFTLTGDRYRADDVPPGTFAGTDPVGLAWDGRSYLYFDVDFKSGHSQCPASDSVFAIRYVTNGVRVKEKDVDLADLQGYSSRDKVLLGRINDLAVDRHGNIYLLPGRGGSRGALLTVKDGAIKQSVCRQPLESGSTHRETYQGIEVVDDTNTTLTLYMAGRNPNIVYAFKADVDGAEHESAYPTGEYDFRTVDQEELRRLAREQHVRNVAISPDGAALAVTKVPEDGTPATENIELPVRTLAVDRLPAPGTAGRQVWVKADYEETGGVSVQPALFAGTGIEGQGYGGRGWWRPSDDGWHIGQLLGEFDDLILLSDTTVIIRSRAIPGISKLHVGDSSFPLTAVSGKQGIKLLGGPDEPAVDVYRITGALPDGVWNNVRIEGATANDQYPGSVTIRQGEYLDTGAAWSPAGFDAPRGDTGHDFEILIRERVPGAATAKAVAFVEDRVQASLYRAAAPFDAVTSITFDGRTGQSNRNRYVVHVASDLAVGGGIPAKLKVGAYVYGLTAGTSDDGTAVFVTPVVDASERVDDANLTRSLDLQYADGSWANGSGAKRVMRTLNREALQRAAGGAPEVTHLPRSPARDQRVRLLAADTISGSGLLEAGLSAAGDFAGWRSDSPAAGSLSRAPRGIASLGSYLQSADAALRNKTIWARAPNSGKTPQYVWINGRRYGVTALGASHRHYWSVNGADGSTFVAGRTYAVQFQWTDGRPVYGRITFAPGDYTWNGRRWGFTPRGLTSLYDGRVVPSISVTTNQDQGRYSLNLLAPAFDLDAVANGIVLIELEATITRPRPAGVGFGVPAGPIFRGTGMVTVSALKRLADYTFRTSPAQRAVAVSMPIYDNNNVLLGHLQLFLGKNANADVGYGFNYVRVGSATPRTMTVASDLALVYQPFL